MELFLKSAPKAAGRLCAVVALAASLAACQAVPELAQAPEPTAEPAWFPSYGGRVEPLTAPLQVQFRPDGVYRFESRDFTDIAVTLPEAGDGLEDFALQFDADLPLASFTVTKEGLAAVQPDGEGFLHRIASRNFSISTMVGSGPAETDNWAEPALLISYRSDGAGNIQDFDLDPLSTLLKESRSGKEVDVALAAESVSGLLVSLFPEPRQVETGDMIEHPAYSLPDQAFSAAGEAVDVRGQVFWEVLGTTVFRGDEFLVGRYRGAFEVIGDASDGVARIGGYSLVDPDTGMEFYWEIAAEIQVQLEGLPVTVTLDEAGLIQPTEEEIKDYHSLVAALPKQ